MEIINTRTLTIAQKQGVLALWNQEYPEKLKYPGIEAFDAYLADLTEQDHFLLSNEYSKILGWAFSFVRTDEKWFAIILDEQVHGQGYGKLLLDELKAKETRLSGWVVDHDQDVKQNGEYYRSPLKFYLKNGFLTIPGIRLESAILSAIKIHWEK